MTTAIDLNMQLSTGQKQQILDDKHYEATL